MQPACVATLAPGAPASDWFCNDLTLGSQRNEGGWPKWNKHGVAFRDDGENYKHYLRGNWQGITAPMRWAMQIDAK